jgi:hypothetical protein
MTVSAFEYAWALLKAPVVEPIPGIKVGYRAGGGLDQSAIVSAMRPEQVIDRTNRAEEEIGNVPYASSAESRMAMMTPNEYFDTIAPYTRVPIQGGRDDEYRWTPRGQSSRDNIDRIIQGLKEGKMIGAPTLSYGGKSGFGYADIPIPVLQQRNFHVSTEPPR